MMVMSIQDMRGDTGVIVINDEGTSIAPVVRVLNNMMDVRIPAAAQRDKSESNLILTWPMLALGLDYAYAKHIDGYIHLHRFDGNMRFGRQSPA